MSLIRTRAVEGGVRLDYRVAAGSGPAGDRFARCRFAPGGQAVLAGITTDRGEVAGATIFLLQRYYIDTPDGIAADPGPAAPDADLPVIPRPLAYALQHAVAGLPGAAVYGLLACAYGLVYGLVGRINLAFGEIAAIGAAATGLVVAGAVSTGAVPMLAGAVGALAIALAASALHGLVAGRAAFALVPARRAQASLVATLGLSLALSEYLRLAGGPAPAWLPPLGADPQPIARAGEFIVTVAPGAVVLASLALIAGSGLAAFMRLSRFGRAWRAAAEEPVAAALCGIDGARLLTLTLALSGALAGLAGALLALRFGALGFADGFALGLKALAGAILGGLGSVPGALLGGFAIGVFEIAWSAYGPIAWRDLALYGLLIGAIVLRPNRLAGAGLDPARRRDPWA